MEELWKPIKGYEGDTLYQYSYYVVEQPISDLSYTVQYSNGNSAKHEGSEAIKDEVVITNVLVQVAMSRLRYTFDGSRQRLPSTTKLYEQKSPRNGCEVKLHTPSFSTSSALPGIANTPRPGTSTSWAGRKSPVTCTLTALGFTYLNVTELSALISGDTIPVPGPSACWADGLTHIAAMAAIHKFLISIFIILSQYQSFPLQIYTLL